MKEAVYVPIAFAPAVQEWGAILYASHVRLVFKWGETPPCLLNFAAPRLSPRARWGSPFREPRVEDRRQRFSPWRRQPPWRAVYAAQGALSGGRLSASCIATNGASADWTHEKPTLGIPICGVSTDWFSGDVPTVPLLIVHLSSRCTRPGGGTPLILKDGDRVLLHWKCPKMCA